MKKLFLGLGVATMASAGLYTVSAARHQASIQPNVVVAGVGVGGLDPDAARMKLRSWWEGERVKKLTLKSPHLVKSIAGATPGMLGVTLDDVATVAQLPMLDLVDDMTNKTFDPQTFKPVFKSNGYPPVELRATLKGALATTTPASVRFVAGNIVRKPEVGGLVLDEPALQQAVVTALASQEPVLLPIKEGPKRITDEQLAQIKDVVSEFTTRFAMRANRVENIRVAAGKLNGVVLLPGERVSFNQTVGRRTIEAGFREAPVFVNGRHESGLGGGICQVSTTLYNASLFADLKIVRRTNHSMPVPYVPIGRDATVNYGAQDLVIENSYSNPIAVTNDYRPGKLTFRILGTKVPGQYVKILRAPVKTWSPPVKTVVDAKLPVGAKVVREHGTSGHSTTTTRVVYLNGVVVKREPLGRSYYAGGSKVIAIGPTAPATPAPTASTAGLVVPH